MDNTTPTTFRAVNPYAVPDIAFNTYYFFCHFQSMELLILSKLQWDLTAITAYDYLDHLLVRKSMSLRQMGDFLCNLPINAF